MKKRIGSKLYDTDTAELVCSIDGGQLYRKRTRDREWFAVFDDGSIRPLDVYNPLDMLLMETGHLPSSAIFDEPETNTTIWVDRETHRKISKLAKADRISITEEVRRVFSSL